MLGGALSLSSTGCTHEDAATKPSYSFVFDSTKAG